MRIDRSHFPWLLSVALATTACALLYWANLAPGALPFHLKPPAFLGPTPPERQSFGGTPLGLVFGALAFAIFLFASALGIRKKQRSWPIGNVQFWLRAHIWLTVFSIPLVALHCGTKTGGLHTTCLLGLYGLVMGSGFLGLGFQQLIPTLMKERLAREVVFEQIPYLRNTLYSSASLLRTPIAEAAAAPSKGDPCEQILCRFLDEECLPYLALPRGERHRLGNATAAREIFRTLKLNVANQWRPQVEELEAYCEQRRGMDLQTTCQHWLHGWLLVHVPCSIALLIFTAWHAWEALRFLFLPPL